MYTGCNIMLSICGTWNAGIQSVPDYDWLTLFILSASLGYIYT